MIKVFEVVEIFQFNLKFSKHRKATIKRATQLQFSTSEQNNWGVIFSNTITDDGIFPENPFCSHILERNLASVTRWLQSVFNGSFAEFEG